MKFSKWVFQAILISLLAAGCISPTSQRTEESTPLSSKTEPAKTRTPLSTTLPVLITAGPITIMPSEQVQPTPTPAASASEQVDLPVLAPSMQIGKGSPTALVVSPGGRWMAIGTQFGVYQYHADTFELAWFFSMPDKAGDLAFDPQSKYLAANAGGDIVILDVESGDLLASLEGAGNSFAWSPDGLRLVSGGGCETVTVWDANRGAVLKELRGGKCSEGYSGIHVAWAADGQIFAATMGSKILAWDGDAYTLIEDFSAEGAPDTWVSALLAAPTGSLLAQYDSLGLPVVAVIDGGQNRQLHLLDRQVKGAIAGLAWAPDGERLAVNYRVDTGLTLIWNARTGQVEQEIEGFYAAAGLGWSADGQALFGLQSLDGQIHAVAVNTGRPQRGLDGHASVGSFLTWTQDRLASTNGATLTWWDPQDGQPLRRETIGSPQAWVISWPPPGPGTYLYGETQKAHQVGTLASRQPLESDKGQYPFPSAWSWDGSRLADPTRVWDAHSGELLARLHDPAQQHTPDKVAWSPDGERLASADSLAMQPPVIWDARSGEVLLSLPADIKNLHPIWLGLAWSPDGERLAAVGSLRYPNGGEYDEGMILIWNADTGGQEQLLTTGMNDYRLWTAAWSPDGRFLACGTTGSEIFLWDIAGGMPLANLGGHTDISDQLAWSPDGSRLASVARDGTLQIWDLSSLRAGTGGAPLTNPTLAQTPSLVPTRTAQLAQRSIQALTTTPTEVVLPTLRDTPLQLPSGLTVEEYALEDRPSFEPLSFSPIQGSQAGVRARRELERRKSFPDNSFFDHMHFSGRASLDGAELVAYEDYNQGGSDGWVIVERNGEQIYQIITGPGSPLTSLQGLWVYDDHWVLETALITSRLEGNMVYTDATGRISQDGKLLNDLYDYEEMFGFQLMAGRPFYFFKQDGKIGFSYDGQAVEAGYDEIPHYSCCSAAGLNPVRAQNMVAFFAQRDSIWYYVEIGVYD